MRPVLIVVVSLLAAACLFAGAASMLGTTPVGDRLEAASPDGTGSALMMPQDQARQNLRVQIDVEQHGSRPQWVLALLFAFVVVGLWIILAAFDVRIPEIR